MSDEAKPPLPGVPASVYDDGHFCKKYELERELGSGASGLVVCALHRELEERVAIKFLLAGHEEPAALARFRREARAANRVKNDHVVRIIDAATTEAGVPYVVMEYLEGLDLERMLLEVRDRQLPVRDAIEFVLQACEGLAECHVNGIVHRDLKPSNLFCAHGADGLPLIKVLDFGISKLMSTSLDSAMTGRHAIIGSPRYMSPEQFDAPADVDLRSDIWSLGVILYELVTGKPPFSGNTLIAIWESVKRTFPRPLAELRPDVPLALAPVIDRCLEKERGNRYPDVAQLAKALLPLAPERSRSSVARIVRIVELPGVTTESLLLPPSGDMPGSGALSTRPGSGSATALSVRPGQPRSHVAWGVGAALGVAIALLFVFWKQVEPPHPPAAVSAATQTTTPASARAAEAERANQGSALATTANGTPSIEPAAPMTGPSATAAATPSASASAARLHHPFITIAPRVPAPAAAAIHDPTPAPSAPATAAPPATGAATSVSAASFPSTTVDKPSTAAFPTAAPSAPHRPLPFITDVVEERKHK